MNLNFLLVLFCRDLYYSTLIHQVQHNKLIKTLDKLSICKVIALIAQIQFGDFNAESLPDYSLLLPSLTITWSRDLQQCVETEHLKLDMKSSTDAKIEFIRIFSTFANYGMDVFHVMSVDDEHKRLVLGVRHDGLKIFHTDPETYEEELVQL